ncbi:PLP-dependent aminotransferase family protein [Zwartia sp.]|uniref:aminotransferase-like domain-containing protein n=1 Tax=Zwartia sp. TaxID=2978004 RepID=UPI0027259A39|nr:PLP-dependent aminotransferase family protein [Zwartia sp.]MDO9025244.1 PLP-dependent aminotransferase family protein [Zwartia sp.]
MPAALNFKLDRESPRTLVDQVVDAVTIAIERRTLRVGDALPSVRALASTHGLSAFTVAEAYQRLVTAGQLSARRGSAYRVADLHASPPSVSPVWSAPSLNAAWLLSDVFADHSVPTKAGCGWIPGEWINESGLQHALRALSRVPGPRFGGYGHPFGMASLREQIATSLRRFSVPADTSNILLTQGATQALDLVVRTLLRPGDTVVVEDPCYCNLLQILQLAGLRVIGVARTADGLDFEQLEQVLKQTKVKAIFVNTVLQNPSGSSLSMTNAQRLLSIAAQAGVWIIEDDIYRELAPPEAPCLAGLEGLSRVIYISGFSKTIAPTLRVGYVAAHRDVLADLARTKMAVGLTSSLVAERIVSNVLSEGHYERHLVFLKEKLRTAHASVVARMQSLGMEIFDQPAAGLFLWARLPIEAERSASVATQALKRGIWLAPGSYFRPGEQPSSWFRFNVANSENDVLWDFVSTLG